jgi:hypothetical protein
MTTWSRLVLAVIAGSLVILQGRESPMTAVSAAHFKEIKVTIKTKDNGCTHDVDCGSETLKKNQERSDLNIFCHKKLTKDQEGLGWRIKNNCRLEQNVLLCVYRKTLGPPVKPFYPCKSNADGDVGKVFKVASGEPARLDCVARDVGEYIKVVLVGDDVPSTGCPFEMPELTTMHRIGIDIQ